jgi:hypothetical protein
MRKNIYDILYETKISNSKWHQLKLLIIVVLILCLLIFVFFALLSQMVDLEN